jgi:hypothetical protein
MPRHRSPRPRFAPRRRLAGVAILVLIAAGAAAADRDTGLARLVGVWQLDSRVSDDPVRELQQASRAGPPPASRRGDRDAGEAAARLDLLERRVGEAVRGDEVLTFAYETPSLRIAYWDDHQRVLRVDGKPVDVDTEDGAAKAEAGWKASDRLVVKTEGPSGRRVEIFELGDRGDHLFVTVEIYRKGFKQPFSYDRVYDRVTAGR